MSCFRKLSQTNIFREKILVLINVSIIEIHDVHDNLCISNFNFIKYILLSSYSSFLRDGRYLLWLQVQQEI